MRIRPLLVIAACLCLHPVASQAAPCDGFTDVDTTNATYCTAVTYLKDKGITLGCGAGTTYCPNDYVTRLQMALFLRRFAQGGPGNTLGDSTSSIGGGNFNFFDGLATYSVIGGGNSNGVSGSLSVVGGGYTNTVTGDTATVPGGAFNTASGYRSFAAGAHAIADKDWCTVFNQWSAGGDMTCLSVGNVFRVGADHGLTVDYGFQRDDGGGSQWVAFGDIFAGQAIATSTGAYLTNGGIWTNNSDRDAKTDFADVDASVVLDKLAALPVTTWRYRNETGQRHLGPMAQDFHAAFGLGDDDRHITTLDASGVALAAIKALHVKVEVRDAQIRELAAENAELLRYKDITERRLEALERALAR